MLFEERGGSWRGACGGSGCGALRGWALTGAGNSHVLRAGVARAVPAGRGAATTPAGEQDLLWNLCSAHGLSERL